MHIVHTDLGAQPFADLTSHDAFCERAAIGMAALAAKRFENELRAASEFAAITDTIQLIESHIGMLKDILADYDAQSEKINEAMRTPLAPKCEVE